MVQLHHRNLQQRQQEIVPKERVGAMANNDVGGVAAAAPHITDAHRTQPSDSLAKRSDQPVRHLLLTLLSSLRQIFADRPTPSSDSSALGRRQQPATHQASDSEERPDRSPKSTPTPSSYQPAGASNSAHSASGTTRSAKRQLDPEAAGSASPSLKKTETTVPE